MSARYPGKRNGSTGQRVILSEKVKARRETLGWSQAELARRVGVKQSIISAIESGKQATTRALPRLAEALGMEMAELDPDFLKTILGNIDPQCVSTAFDVILEILCPHYEASDRDGLARVLLDLARAPLDDKVGGALRDQMRLRVGMSLQPYLKAQ